MFRTAGKQSVTTECFIYMNTTQLLKTGCIHIQLMMIMLLSLGGFASAQEKSFVTVNTVKARFLGMGGASVSVTDDLAALDYNPAGFRVNQSYGWELNFFNNYIGLSAYLAESRETSDFWEPLGFVLKGVSVSKGRFSFGVILGEESLSDRDRIQRKKIFDFEGYAGQRNQTIGFSFALAPRVSFGVAAECLIRGEEKEKEFFWGYRYGLILKPREKISVGICYFDLSERYASARRSLDRFSDESLNVGISYEPVQSFRLAADVRNVSDEGRSTTREPHVGFEWIPVHHLAIRGGSYFPRDNVATISAGLSLFDWNRIKSTSQRFPHATFALNAAVLWQQNRTLEDGTFILGGLIRF